MPDMPSAELLEATHAFPCSYMFKGIGDNDMHLVARVRDAIRQEVADEYEPAVSIRRSSSGRHLCVTIEPRVTDAAQVLAIYERIYAIDGLVMVW